MKNVTFVLIAGLSAVVFGCDNSEHPSHVHNEVVPPVVETQAESTGGEIPLDKAQEENGCDTNSDSADSPPLGITPIGVTLPTMLFSVNGMLVHMV